MLQLPHHQDLNMPPNFPMSNDSGFHETDSPKAPPSHHDIGSPDPGYTEMGGSSPDSLMDSGLGSGEHDDYDLPPINTRNDVGLSDQELLMKTTRELNKLLKKRGIDKDRQKELKQERRTLKNRGYAANCRVKRETEEKTLEKRNDKMRYEMEIKMSEIEEAKKETEQMKRRYCNLNSEIEQLKKEHELYLMKVEEDNATRGQERGLKALLANRTEIKWEKVKEEPVSPISLKTYSI